MKTTNWKDLIVSEGEPNANCGTLGFIVHNAPANLDDAEISGGKITSWDGFFLSAPGEVADWNTPRGDVDWDGFAETLAAQKLVARSEAEARREQV